MVRGRSVLLFALLIAPTFASAETMSFGDSAALVRQSGAAEIDAHSRRSHLDSNRLKECLSRNRDALSPTCASTYLKTFDAIQKRVAARVAVANACTREIVKLCGGSTKETSKSIPCLITAQGVSPRCIQSLGDAGYR